jgi:hypothetical protein
MKGETSMRKLDLGKRLLGLALAGLVVMVGPIAVPRPASAQGGGVAYDPAGDVPFHAPAFQDIVGGEIQKVDGSFILSMEMAGPIPEKPTLPPPGTSEIWWVWGFDLNPNTVPHGYPFPPGLGLPLPAEVMVYVAWDGTQFTGNAIDRRPLLTGRDASVTPVRFQFSSDRKTIQAFLTPTGFPASFMWGPRTFDWSSPPGKTGGIHIIDVSTPSFNPSP